MRTGRETVVVPSGIGVGHVLLVLGLLLWSGYPLDWFVGTALLQFLTQILGLFLLAFIPVLVFAQLRLGVPLGLSLIGFGIATVAGLMTPHPEFAPFGEDLLTVGRFYVGAYANGWYVWLLAYGLSGACEYVVRTTVDGLDEPLVFSRWQQPLDRLRSVPLWAVAGVAHTVVIIALGIGHEAALHSGLLLGWGLLGVFLLGSIPMLFLIRSQLISPLAGLVTIQLIIGVETLLATSATPVSSYMLFWPVYFLLLLLLVVGEYVVRWGHRDILPALSLT